MKTKTKTKNLVRIIFMILFGVQLSLLTTSCKYLEGNEVVNNEDVAIVETVTETEIEQTAPQTEEEIKAEEEAVQTQLWMDNIADVDWENVGNKNWTLRFNKPVQEGDIITGEMVENYTSISTFRYERISEGEVKCKEISKDANGNIIDRGRPEFTLKMKLQDDGNTLIFDHSDGRVLTFKRS